MPSTVLLVDAFNLIRRIFEASAGAGQFSDVESLSSSDINGRRLLDDVLKSSRQSLQRALKQHPSSHACVVFDSHELSWRHHEYPDYKANRKPAPSILLDNIHEFEIAFKSMGIKCLTVANTEADDVIATLAMGVEGHGGTSIIVSTDKGFLPMLSPSIKIINHFEQTSLTKDYVVAKFAVKPEQLTDFWALAGDVGNNIKGVPKIGKKTAVDLLNRFGSLDNILNAKESGEKKIDKLLFKVQEHAELAKLCKRLVTSNYGLVLGINLQSLRIPNPV